MNAATAAELNLELSNRHVSITGTGARSARCTVRAPAMVAATNSPTTRPSSQPHTGPWTEASTSSATAVSRLPTDNASGSRLPTGWRTLGNNSAPTMTARTPIGTLTRKIQRHDTEEIRPPSSGPHGEATAETPDQMPTTMMCWRRGNDGYSRPSEVGTIIAAPTAWIARPAMSIANVGASAQISDARVNTTTPASRMFLRPRRSATRPAGTSIEANTIAYTLSTHDTADRFAPPKSAEIGTMATLTTKKPTCATNATINSSPRIAQRRGSAMSWATGWQIGGAASRICSAPVTGADAASVVIVGLRRHCG